jgi:endonuclease YncB( thermonuclease family)
MFSLSRAAERRLPAGRVPRYSDAMRILPALIVALFTSTATAHADVVGRASVADGDTIEVRGERVRLYGIDAPEAQQLCTISGEPYR